MPPIVVHNSFPDETVVVGHVVPENSGFHFGHGLLVVGISGVPVGNLVALDGLSFDIH